MFSSWSSRWSSCIRALTRTSYVTTAGKCSMCQLIGSKATRALPTGSSFIPSSSSGGDHLELLNPLVEGISYGLQKRVLRDLEYESLEIVGLGVNPYAPPFFVTAAVPAHLGLDLVIDEQNRVLLSVTDLTEAVYERTALALTYPAPVTEPLAHISHRGGSGVGGLKT